MTKLTADYTDANRAVAALRCRVSALKDSKLISCSDVNCGKTAMMAEKKSKTRSRYSMGEWYGRAFEFFSPKQRRDQAKLHAGLTTIAGLDCPFQKNRICTKKAGVCSLRKYEQIGQRNRPAGNNMSEPVLGGRHDIPMGWRRDSSDKNSDYSRPNRFFRSTSSGRNC